jgi:heptosyltransferase III
MNSVLVVQLKRLGDVILTTPALRELRKLYPKARITLLLDHQSAGVGPAIADVDEVWIYNREASFTLWFDLVRHGFDLCLDFTGNDRSALIAFLSKAPRRIGFSHIAKRAARSWVYTNLVQSPVREKHTAEHYIDLVRSLGDSVSMSDVSLRLTDSVLRSAATLRREIGVSGSFFVVHPGAARLEKFWAADRWAAVIRHVQRRLQIPCLVTGGRHPAELRHIDAILASSSDTSKIFNLAGKLDFLLSLAIIREGILFAGVDTAAAHVASAFHRPQLVLFGPTNPFQWHPLHASSVVVRAGFADPLRSFEPRQKGAAMSELSTQTVIRGMEIVFEYLR